MERILQYYRELCLQEDECNDVEEKTKEYIKSKACTDDFVQAMREMQTMTSGWPYWVRCLQSCAGEKTS